MTARMSGSILEHATVVQHDRITSGPLAFESGRVGRPAANAFRVDLRDHLIFPGLINAHDHLQLNCIPPLPHAEAFSNSYAWMAAFELHRKDPDVIAAVNVPAEARHWHGGLKNVLAGTTTVGHHDPPHPALDDSDFPVGPLRDFGWSHSLRTGEQRGDRPARYGPPVCQSFADTPTDWPWIIHLAEGTDAVAGEELALLDTLGCLADNTVLVHGVGLTHSDVDRVIERGASVVWCPASNLEMLGRTLDARRLFDAQRLALGTDSRLTGSRDLLDELRVAAAHSDLCPRELLRLVTFDASWILRLPERGSLDFGQTGDCVIMRSGDDPYAALIDTSRSEIRAVVRGGAPIVADPDFAEWFAHCGISVVRARLDGKPKLLAERLARPEIVALEPGLEIA